METINQMLEITVSVVAGAAVVGVLLLTCKLAKSYKKLAQEYKETQKSKDMGYKSVKRSKPLRPNPTKTTT